jgi:ribosome hibernation promoting factor
MKIEVVGVHLDVTSSLEAYVKNRIGLSLDRFVDRISNVTIRLDDISGPHGPGTKRCHMEVHLIHLDAVIVEQDHTDIYTAVDKAANRLKRTVRRHINRVRDARRSHHRESLRTAWT